MKKYLSTILSAGLVALAAVSCIKEQGVTFDPSKSTAPVVQSYTLTDDALVIDYIPGNLNQDFNTEMPVNHSVILKSVNGKDTEVQVPSTNKDNKLTVTVSNLSKLLMNNYGYAEGEKVSLVMVLRASLQETARDNLRNGYVESTGSINLSDYEIFLPTGDPYARYTEVSPWSLIGSFNDWSGDYEMVTNGTLHVAKGVELKAGDAVKFRKDASWDVNLGYAAGIDSYTLGEDFALAQDGGDIHIADDGVYDFILDPESNTAKIIVSVAPQEDPYASFTDKSEWSVIGSFNDWAGDYEMVTNGSLHVAKNITLAAGTEFKFRKNASWDVNLGYAEGVSSYELGVEFALAQDGGNIVIAEDGSYDFLLDPETSTAQIILTKAVTIDPYASYTEVSPWSVIGSFNSWAGDYEMVTNGTLHVAKAIALNAGEEWKFRKDGDWTVNYGYADGVSSYELGEEFALGQDGANIVVAEDGVYDFILDPENATGKVIASVAVEQPDTPAPVEKPKMWSLVGYLNGTSWDTDFDLTNTSGNTWVITNVAIGADDEFKIRADHDWAKSWGGPEANATSTAEENNPYDVYEPVLGETFTAGSLNIRIGVAGNYNITFTYGDAPTILIEEYKEYPDHLYMIGEEFGGWDWNSDGVVEMVPVIHQPGWGANAEAQFWTVRYFSAGKGFKFCGKREWNGDFWGLETNDGFTESDGNCTVDADGIYLVHIDLKNSKVHVEPARVYGIGNCFGGWTEGMEAALFKADGKTLKATTLAAGPLRMYVASEIATSDWWTREFVFYEDGKIDYRGDDEGQGDQAGFEVKQGQEIVLDFNAGKGEVKGEGEAPSLPESMYIIGEQFGNWAWTSDSVVDMIPVYGQAGQFWAIRNIEAGKGFKFCSVKEWSGDFYSLGDGDSGFTVSGGNCFVEESGVYMITVDVANAKICVEPAKVYGIGPCFGGAWDENQESARFTEVDGKLVGTTTGAGEIRIYAASSIATSDWWTREFVFFDGKIAYRGDGGDQERVNVEAGKKVTLDFNAGTATVE